MDRRQFLATSSIAAGTALVPMSARAAAQAAAPAASGDARLNALFEEIFQDRVKRNPELATSLGLDKGANAHLKSELDVRPYPQAAQGRHCDRKARPRPHQGGSAGEPVGRGQAQPRRRRLPDRNRPRLRREVRHRQRPAALSDLPAGRLLFLDAGLPQHARTRSTMPPTPKPIFRAWRWSASRSTMTPTTSAPRPPAASSRPAWSIDLTLGQMRKLRAPAPGREHDGRFHRPADQGQGHRRRLAGARRQDRRRQRLSGARPPDRADGETEADDRGPATAPGACPMATQSTPPRSQQATTTNFTPDEVHQLGLAQVAEISAQLDTILKGAGFTTGTVGERLDALNRTPAQLYANTARRPRRAARQPQRRRQGHVRPPAARLRHPADPAARNPPRAGGNPGRRLQRLLRRAALDGSRPAIYFINLKDVGDWPKYSLPTLTYHEGVPGHHLQISIAQESKDIPTLAQDRRLLGLFRRLGALCRAARRRARRL